MDRAMQHSHCTAHAPDMNSLWMLRAQRSCPTHAFTSRAPQPQRWVSPQGALRCAIQAPQLEQSMRGVISPWCTVQVWPAMCRGAVSAGDAGSTLPAPATVSDGAWHHPGQGTASSAEGQSHQHLQQCSQEDCQADSVGAEEAGRARGLG